MDNEMVPVCLTFPRQLKASIDAAARADGRTRSGFVRKVMVATLEQNPEAARFNPFAEAVPASPGRRAGTSPVATPGRPSR